MTIFDCLRPETAPTWRARSAYFYPPGTGWPGYNRRHWVPFSSPPTTLRDTVDVFGPASTRNKTCNSDLYELIKIHKPMCRTFKRDWISAEHGHSISVTPLYHPELNPTKLMWAVIVDRNVTFRREAMIKLAEEKFALVSKDVWKLRCIALSVQKTSVSLSKLFSTRTKKLLCMRWQWQQFGHERNGNDGAGLYSIYGMVPLILLSDTEKNHVCNYWGSEITSIIWF
jgi:hypothetical protein